MVGQPLRVVLVVEDEPDVRDYAVTVLREDGSFLVIAVADAGGALEIMQHVIVDVLSTDIVMPGSMGGVELARVARRLNPDVKIVCTTGFARAAEAALLDFCERLVRKPYKPAQLRAEIRRVLAA
jgi:CheY-like chemotaxis protein